MGVQRLAHGEEIPSLVLPVTLRGVTRNVTL
jgi:hypothetical protein